jgi:hypothetical protein
MEVNPNLSPAVTHQPSLLGGAENMKLLFDDTLSFLSRVRTNASGFDNAWNAYALSIATDAQTAKHLANINAVISGQTGQSADQQTVSPIRTGAADNLAAGGAPTNRVTDAAGNAIAAGNAESVQTNVTAQVAEMVTQVGTLTTMVTSMNANVTTALQALADSNTLIASALSALKSTGGATS